jgi:magnesium chelatase family protein
MNLCPCGARGDAATRCACTPQRVQRYREKLSRALLDRFDLALTVPRPRGEELAGPPAEPSVAVRDRVLAAQRRLVAYPLELTDEALHLLTRAVERVPLSGRGRARVARVATTIAALAGAGTDSPVFVEVAHLAEALSYRPPRELTE